MGGNKLTILSLLNMSLVFKLLIAGVVASMACAMEKPCCISKKFFGKMKVVTVTLKNGSSIPIVSDNRFEIDYDYDMKMERVMGTIHTDEGGMQTATNYSVINDYNMMKSYTMTSDSASCAVNMLDGELFSHCLPSTLMWTAKYTFGSGAEALHVNSWEGVADNFYMSFQTSVNDCTPVSMTRVGMTPDGDRISESVLYADVTQYDVSSADAFKVPDMCMMVGSAVGK